MIDRDLGTSINSFDTDAPHGAKLSPGNLPSFEKGPDERPSYVHEYFDEAMSNVDADVEVNWQSESSRTAVTVKESNENKHAQWRSMFAIRTSTDRPRKPESDLLSESAERTAVRLRDRVTMPANPTNMELSITEPDIVDSGARLPPVSCAFRKCGWKGGGETTDRCYRDDSEHPWDQQLREHVLAEHRGELLEDAAGLEGCQNAGDISWGLYKAALSIKERQQIPIVGPSVDRRAFEHTSHVYNDDRIRSLICFACAQVKLDTGRIRSAIEFRSGTWFFSLPKGSLTKNFSMDEFRRLYCQSGSPFAFRGSDAAAIHGPYFSDWRLRLDPEYRSLLLNQKSEVFFALSELRRINSSARHRLTLLPRRSCLRKDVPRTEIVLS